MNLQHENTNSKGDFVLKNRFKRSFYRFLVYKNKSEPKISIYVFKVLHFPLKFPLPHWTPSWGCPSPSAGITPHLGEGGRPQVDPWMEASWRTRLTSTRPLRLSWVKLQVKKSFYIFLKSYSFWIYTWLKNFILLLVMFLYKFYFFYG